MRRWDELDTKYRAFALTLLVFIIGGVIMIGTSLTFNWYLHQKTVEEFMATEDARHMNIIAAHENFVHGEEGYIVLSEDDINLRNYARIKRIETVEAARHRLGDAWNDPDVKYFVMYGVAPKK